MARQRDGEAASWWPRTHQLARAGLALLALLGAATLLGDGSTGFGPLTTASAGADGEHDENGEHDDAADDDGAPELIELDGSDARADAEDDDGAPELIELGGDGESAAEAVYEAPELIELGDCPDAHTEVNADAQPEYAAAEPEPAYPDERDGPDACEANGAAVLTDGAAPDAGLTMAEALLLAGLALLEGDTFPRGAGLALARAAASLQAGGDPLATSETEALAALDGLRRWELLETLDAVRLRLSVEARAWAAELLRRLPESVANEFGDALLRYWTEAARELAAAGVMSALEPDFEAVMGALASARARGRDEGLVALARALQPLWDAREPSEAERAVCQWVRDAAQATGDGASASWAMARLARLALLEGDAVEALSLLREAETLAREQGALPELREALHALALLDSRAGRPEDAWARHEEALRLARELGDARAEREALHGLAVLDAQGGRVDEARTGFEAGLALARTAGDLPSARAELHGLGVLDAREGRIAHAREAFEEALRLARELGDARAERNELHELAVLEARAGHVEEARAGFEAALRLARNLDDLVAQSIELQSLGFRDLNMGRAEQAREELTEALELARRVRQPVLIARALWSLAEVDARERRREAACAGFREALELYETVGDPDAHNAYLRIRLRELGCPEP